MSSFIRLQTPIKPEDRLEFHRQFGGSVPNLKAAVKAYMINCLKSSAPLMSASENQSARKAEFSQTIEKQLTVGLFEMKKVERILKDKTDEKGQPITVFATEVITDNNLKPLIAQESPLVKDYHLTICQFSITGTEYDQITRDQFAAKKTFFLKAEQNKAEREQMVQERLKIEEEGKKNVAAATAIGNVEKAKNVIAAQQKAEVAEKIKQEAEMQANMKLSVAKIEKEEAETKANKDLSVATIQASAALKQAEAISTLATAQQNKIKLAGAITEKENVLAQIHANMQVEIAKAYSVIRVPTTIFMGGGNGPVAGGGSYIDQLMAYRLGQASGLFDNQPIAANNEAEAPKK